MSWRRRTLVLTEASIAEAEAPGVSELESKLIVEGELAGLVVGRGLHMHIPIYALALLACESYN